MKIPFVLLLAALALTFALVGCAHASVKTAAADTAVTTTKSDTNDADAGEPEEHRKTVLAHAEDFRSCYAEALKKHPRLSGEVVITWDVDDAGDVIQESVVDTATSIHSKIMIDCMLTRVHMWKFNTGPKNQISTVTYPFYFTPPSRQ